jgi:glucosyl-dolichyl phosphate glucuronosyltransferase
MPECPRTTAGCGTLLVRICRFAPRCLRRTGGFASKLGRREAGGAIVGSVAESCEETEFCIRAARLHPGGRWIHCDKARVLHVGTRQRTTWRYFVRRCRMEGTAKAVLTGLTGTQDGLGSERRYTPTLAVSIMRHIVSGHLTRAATIFAGLTITAAAHGRGRLARGNF